MTKIKSGHSENGHPIELDVQDLGSGSPIVLIHGWPLYSASWNYQLTELPKKGFRVVTYDRRGFGHSSQPYSGYNYDAFADDLKAVLDGLDLHDVTLVGFSMGGGEIARYMSRHSGARVKRVAFVSAVTPYLLKTDGNPDGVDKQTFDDMVDNLNQDRFDFLQSFGKKFYGVGMLSKPVSQATLDWTFKMALLASPKATVDCVRAFSETDFRDDVRSINVPTLIIHGTDDQTVPIEASGERLAELLPHATFLRYEGAPHGLFITDKDRLNTDLADFAAGGMAAQGLGTLRDAESDAFTAQGITSPVLAPTV